VSFPDAARFLLVTSAKNRVASSLKKLRNPRYLVGGAVALWYLYNLAARGFVDDSGQRHAGHMDPIFVEVGLLGVLLAGVLWNWAFGPAQPAFQFNEAEIQWLFSAPVTRRQLVHYRLARILASVLLGAVVSSLFFGRAFRANGPFLVLGTALTFMALALHRVGTSITRANLSSHGARALRRSGWGVLLFVLASIGAAYLVLEYRVPELPDEPSSRVMADWLRAVITEPPLGWLLAPLRVLLDVAFARSLDELFRALPWALGVVGLNYLWVLRSDTAFEDASIELAERRARTRESRRGRRSSVPAKAGKTPFPLSAPAAWPAGALTWKSWVSAWRGLAVSKTLVVLVVLAFPTLVLLQAIDSTVLGPEAACLGLAFFLGFAALLWPLSLRIDLRQDIGQLEVLKALPLSGRQVVWAEMMAPAAFLVGMELLALAAMGALFQLAGVMELENLELRWPLWGGALAVVPAVTLASVLVQNAAAVLFPGWVSVEVAQTRGIEATGQRLLNLAATLLALVLGVLPCGAVGAALALLLAWFGQLGLGLVLGCWVASALLGVEIWVCVGLLGRAYEALDPSSPA
jgi:hypothetical protein